MSIDPNRPPVHLSVADDQQVAPTSVLDLHAVTCTYPGQGRPVHALRSIDLTVAAGSFTAVMGPSGSGKTTLLHCAAGLQTPTSGSIRLRGRELAALDHAQLAELRRRELGLIFQSFNLLPALTAIENVELPLVLDRRRPDRAVTEAILERVGLGQRGQHRPPQLSGGQQQRVAVARALITGPQIVFADEPTGALDLHSAREVLSLLRELADAGQTIIMVTHDPVAAARADMVLFLADGRIVDRLAAPDAQSVGARMARLIETAEISASPRPVQEA